ncbi:MAG: hypothetical protein DI592_23950, partial [Stenotrophomonas maltophilia]
MPTHAPQSARLPLAAALALCLLPAASAFAQDGATTLDSIQVSGSWLGTLLKDQLPAQDYGRLLLMSSASAPLPLAQRTRQVCAPGDVDPNSDAAWEHPEAWVQAQTVAAVTTRDCQACPWSTREERDQWLPTSQACPSGQTGTHTWERQQVRSRDVFTHCPFGTTALPGPTYGGWSNWVDTGARRNEVNTCKPTAA